MGEPEPEVACAKPIVFEESLMQYAGLNLVKRILKSKERYFFVTQNPMTTYNLETTLKGKSKINIQIHVDNNVNITLANGRVISPNLISEDKELIELLLRNVFNWISEFNSTDGYPSCFLTLKMTQNEFLQHSLHQHMVSTDVRSRLKMEDNLTGFFNVAMCYRLSTIILLYNMLPQDKSYNNPILKFWFDEFKEIQVVLNHLTKTIELLNLPKEYIERYVIGGINTINEDLEKVKKNDFYNDFFGSILELTGMTRNELATLYRGMEQQQGLMGGALSMISSNDNLSMSSRYKCKSSVKNKKKTESFIMKKILNYITQNTGENREELEEIFSDKNMNPELLESVGKFLFNLLEVKKQGGASSVGPSVFSLGAVALSSALGAENMTIPIGILSYTLFRLWGTSTYNKKKEIAMEILVKQKRCYTIYCVMRIQAQNIYDFSCTYNYFGFQPKDILHNDASELKTVAFLGRNSYTILFQLVHYFLDNDNVNKLWNIPLILATTAYPNFSWGKEFALEFITDRNNPDVKVIPFMDVREPVKKYDEFEIIYISPESHINLPMGVTFEQVKVWANECLSCNGGFENDTIENQRLRLTTFGKKFFTRRSDIGNVKRDPNLAKYTLTLNLIRTNNFDEYNKDINRAEIQHSRVKNVLLNCVRTIQDDQHDKHPREPNTPLPITETFLDYIKDIFESNNDFITGAKKIKRRKKNKTRKKNRKTKSKRKKYKKTIRRKKNK